MTGCVSLFIAESVCIFTYSCHKTISDGVKAVRITKQEVKNKNYMEKHT